MLARRTHSACTNNAFAEILLSHVSIIGTGNMGQAIAGVVTKGGNSVDLLGRADAGKPVTGEIVILAVYYSAIPDVHTERGDSLPARSSSASATR